MPVTVSHALSMTAADDPLYENNPSDWNQTHAVTINAVGSEISGAFGNGGGVTFGLSADGKITASAPAAGGGLTNINVSAGTTSNNLSALTFSNGGGVSFGIDASVITATVATNYQPAGAYLTTAMASNRGSDFVQATAAFAGTNASGTIASNGISVSVGNYITTAMASNRGTDFVQAAAAFAGTNASGTIASNGISVSVGNYITTAMASNRGSDFVQAAAAFAGTNASGTIASNGISVSVGNYITTAMASNRGSDFVQATAAFAGTNASGTIASNGISVSVGNYITTAALSNHSHGNPTLNLTNLSGTTASASNGFTLSLSANSPAAGVGVEAGTRTATTAGNLRFETGNGVTFGLNAVGGSVMTASVAAPVTLSYHRLLEFAGVTVSTSAAQSTSIVAPFQIPQNLSIDRARMIYSGSVAASSTQATVGGTSYSMSGITSHNMVFYSRGAGANSLSLQYVTSTQHVDQQLVTISFAANSTQMSYSNRLTLGSDSFTKDYSTSVGSIHYHTSNLTDLTGVKYIDIPCGISLSPGQYWVAYGRSTTAATGNAAISVATRMLVSHNIQLAHSQATLAMGMLGGNTNSSVGQWPALGSFTTGGAAGTTNSIPMANVSTMVSNVVPSLQFMRIV